MEKSIQDYISEAVTNFRRGTTEMLLLAMLTQREWFATEMTHVLTERCPETFDLQNVHICQIMRRLAAEGFVATRIQPSENGRLKYVYYRLLPPGREYLEEMVKLYRHFEQDVASMLDEMMEKREDC